MNITINVDSSEGGVSPFRTVRRVTTVICSPDDYLEVNIEHNGKADAWSRIPERDGCGDEPHENVTLNFCVRQHPLKRFNEDHGKEEDSLAGIGELWIRRLPDANSLSFTTYIAFETDVYLKSLQGFEAQFEINETPLRQSEHGEAYLIEIASFKGLTIT
tara:strand:+ start:1243 stop:1722 length:480 start_codon:yes stop_codon:yes gene_type:complete